MYGAAVSVTTPSLFSQQLLEHPSPREVWPISQSLFQYGSTSFYHVSYTCTCACIVGNLAVCIYACTCVYTCMTVCSLCAIMHVHVCHPTRDDCLHDLRLVMQQVCAEGGSVNGYKDTCTLYTFLNMSLFFFLTRGVGGWRLCVVPYNMMA